MKIKILILLMIFVSGLFFVQNVKKPHEVCLEKSSIEKPSCWKNQFEQTLNNGGIEGAFELLKKLYETDSDFVSTCHDYTHLIGEKAYYNFRNGENIKIGKESVYCGYGFYHGYIITLLKTGEPAREGSRFCETMDAGAKMDCFHGMGHGFVDFNATELRSIDLVQTVLDNGIALCESVVEEGEGRTRCKDGVFHSLFDLAIGDDNLTNLVAPSRDPFYICQKQSNENKNICLVSTSTLVMKLSELNFEKAVTVIVSRLGAGGAGTLRQMSGYAAYLSMGDGDVDTEITVCKKLSSKLKEECVKGLVEGVTDFGEPGKEEQGVKNFCSSPVFSTSEQEFCFEHASDYFGRYFGGDKNLNLKK